MQEFLRGLEKPSKLCGYMNCRIKFARQQHNYCLTFLVTTSRKGFIKTEVVTKRKHMSNQSNGKTWADFFSENKALVWFIFLVAACFSGYLIYNNWVLRYGDIELSPPKAQDITEETSTSKNKDTKTIVQTPSKPKVKNQNPEASRTSNSENTGDTQIHQSFMTGSILDTNGKPALNAKIVCDNCLTSDGPKYADEFGSFRMAYQVEYKTNEYSLKSLEFTIIHNQKTYSASQSISQKSLKIELK
ncbi:MAG: hypothetical protein IPM36_17200 [Lewinellaceae bacterium]|nr:hypothetical protein [Lewinellaceae bacterium]